MDLRRCHRWYRPHARPRRRRPRTPGRRHRRASTGRLPAAVRRSGTVLRAPGRTSSRHRTGSRPPALVARPPHRRSVRRGAARHVNLSERQFTRVFKAEVGSTAADHVEAVRLESACRLLETTNRTIEQIAKTCGFGTPETMNRAFRRRLDTTPGDHRHHFRGRTPSHQGKDVQTPRS
ncbi:helix-turn-helix domain-containing protein [Kribbella sp. NPDC049227]|uniref:helix-turn-helix domain-containing protein n=1 Tax=Kribbella sp. NPDC049227 TaxID=3364113 RepID=UPI00371535F2